MRALGAPHGANRFLLPSATLWVNTLGAAGAVAIVYFLAARLGLALLSKPSDLAVFWPASGIAAGILITLGRRARPALVIGVVIGTLAAKLMSDRSLLTSLLKGVCNAGEAVLVAWFLERWFDRPFRIGDLPRLAGFLVAACLATVASATGGAAIMTLLHAEAPYWDVWWAWFLSSYVGIVVVAPLMIELAQVWRWPPSRREWVEGMGVLSLATLASFYTMSHATTSWLSFSPGAIVLPILLWLTARCQPAFGVAGAFSATAAVMLATTFGIGRFGDAAVPLMERVKGAQAAAITITLFTLILIALFAQRKKTEEELRESEGQLAKKSAALARLHEVGTRLWYTRDLRKALDDILSGAIELLSADMGIIRILDPIKGVLKIEVHRGFTKEFLGSFCEVPASSESPCGRALRSGKRMVIADVDADTLFTPFLSLARLGGFRAVQSTPIMGREGVLLGTLATHFHSTHQPTEQDFRLLELYVRQAADIIDRHNAENALRESEERLQLAQLRTGIGIWDRSLRTGKVTWTPELEALFGLEPGSVKCYTDFRDRVHPDDIQAFEAQRDAAVRDRKTFTIEFRIIRADGQLQWMSVTGGAVYDEVTGEPVRILGNFADITERKQAELALADRNLQLRLAEMAGLIGSYASDTFTEIGQISSGYAAIHGLPEGTTEITRSEWLARVHPEDVDRLQRCRSEALRERREEYKVDYRIIRQDGEVRWIESRVFIVYGSDATGHRLTGVNIDITERKRGEQALVERNILLALAGRAARVGTFAYDTDKEILQISEDYAAIHGLPAGTAKIARSEWLAGVHPQDVERVELPRSEAFREQRNEYSAEFRVIRPGGEVRWVEVRCFITYDGNGHPKRVVGVSTDVTDRKQAELRLTERNAQLALAGRAALVGSYAYDVKKGTMQVSEGYAAIHGLPEGTTETRYSEWRTRAYPEDLEMAERLRNQAFANRRKEDNAEYRIVLSNGEVRWIERRGSISYDDDGHPERVVGVNIDVTGRKRAEERQRILVAELDHRVKNTLATVSAVVSHTRQGSRSASDFAEVLEGRLRSMAATHELLSARWWQGVSLTELARRELAPYAARNNTELTGPEVVLRAEAGQAMAMVLHELATNAAKYGALSTKKGRVLIRWKRRLNGRPRTDLVLEWQEIGGPTVSGSGTSGYGTSTIRDLIPYEFGGTVDLVFAPEGVQCRLKLPADWLSDAADPGSEVIADAAAK